MAARGINKVILVGNIGADPEVRYSPNGTAITTLSVATSEVWKEKETGNKQERTEWHRVVCFNRLGEIAGEYVRKGSKLYVEGSLRTRKWQDQQGQDRYTTEIIANDIQMLDSKNTAGNFSSESPAPAYTSQNTRQSPPSDAAQEAFDALNDDIPF